MRHELRGRGQVTGVGSLPHRSAGAAARFSFEHCDIPFVPTLPRRSPAEGMISQAIAGMRGFSVGQYGAIAVDVEAIDLLQPVNADFADDAFRGWRAFLDEAAHAEYRGWVKWQFVGPVTLGIALARAGVPEPEAFDAAVSAVRQRLGWLLDIVDEHLPGAPQLVVLDEPSFAVAAEEGFALAPDAAIDLVSAALSLIERRAVSGLHCCAGADVGALVATGPHVLSVPVHQRLCAPHDAARLAHFVERGGVVAWGAVPTMGPLASAERCWKALLAVWGSLVERGIEPELLVEQSLVTPECGLGTHVPQLAEEVFGRCAGVAARVREHACMALRHHDS